jgi:hypothetical protein
MSVFIVRASRCSRDIFVDYEPEFFHGIDLL